MADEIERKFLVKGDAWRKLASPVHLRQGYLSDAPERTVRVRVTDDRAWLTVKGLTHGASRREYEYEIAAAEACQMLDTLCLRPLVEKNRYRIPYAGLEWEVDE